MCLRLLCITAAADAAALPVSESPLVQELPSGVAIPDVHTLVLQLLGIGAALDKPQQLLHDTYRRVQCIARVR